MPAAETSRSTTPTKRMDAVIQSPAEAIRQDAYRSQNVSPPRTPSRRRKDPPSSYPRSARLAAATGAATFFDDIHGYDRDSPTDDDTEDHHDLTYNSKHIPRASLVDNMVMALDQFSISSDLKFYEEEVNEHFRKRGHTFSSSVSSESDIRTLQSKIAPQQTPKPMRRSSARYARDPAKLPSIFGEDEDSTRVRVYEAQRAAQPPRSGKRRSGDGKTKSANSTSSIDLPHLKHLQGRLGPAGNRRSQSFDFSSKTRADNEDDANTAPHPVVYAGPKAQKAPVSPTAPPANLVRRDSGKSAKAVKNKSSTVGTSAVHSTSNSAVPLTISATSTGRGSPVVDTEQGAIPRAGLFRRFFGSSKNLAGTPPPTSTLVRRISQDNGKESTPNTTNKIQKQPPKEEGSNKENQYPVLQKKPSSFFRRRKKSITTAIVPPVPLTLDSAISQPEPGRGAPSPVSSLKAFMDPYLTDEKGNIRSSTPTSPLRTFYTATQNSAGTGLSRIESPDQVAPPRTSSHRLIVPQKETFLTDSSSAEDVEQSTASDVEEPRKTHTTTTKTPQTVSSTQWAPWNTSTTTSTSTSTITTTTTMTMKTLGSRTASATSGYSTIRPVVEARSSSWQSERLGIPPRSDSLPPLDINRTTNPTPKAVVLPTQHRNTSGSDVSEYKSAPSTPAVTNVASPILTTSPRLHISHPSIAQGPTIPELDKAQEIYNNGEDDVDGRSAAAWLGEIGSERERIRKAYMQLFDWTGHNILSALRALCSRLVLKAESQLIDRILDAFSKRWCDSNPNHGFKSSDVVHTICYSVLLLNTDLHMADIGSKMTRNQFVRNAMQTIRPVAAEVNTDGQLLIVRSNSAVASSIDRISVERDSSRAASALSHRPTENLVRSESGDVRADSPGLVDAPYNGTQVGWESQIEAVLKDFYFSIQRQPLPLFGSENAPRHPPNASNNNLLSLGGLRRTPSVLSKAQSDTNRSRYGDSKSLGAKWNSKGRSRPRLGSTPGFGSSKNSLDDQSSAWSPSMSSTWSRASLGKTLTSMSVDSFATSSGGIGNDYQSSIGFANALSQAIIREDQMETQTDDGMKASPLLEDESLELEGAPWAKEGIMKHKCHLEGVDKRARDRNWNDCFAVIEKGWMRLFSFSVTAKSLRSKARNKEAGAAVGGGNWQDNAEEVWKFMLRHTIASSLPPPGYSKARPYVWALSLPTGAVHLFSVGTPDIVKEFVSSANFWSARLSKEPMIGGISSMEYGWSDAVINRTLAGSDVRPSLSSGDMPRPSTQMSIRSSLDHGGSMRPRLPGDKIHVSDWTPPQQSLLASQLMEVDQLKALQTYVQNIEEELQKHNELRVPMGIAFSTKHANYNRAMGNWEKKSSYLLREIVKFKNYIDALQGAQQTKERIYKMRREEERQRQADDDSMAIYQSTSMGATGTS